VRGDTRSRGGAPRPSGRFLLRLAPALHQALKAAASDAGLSLNDYCARKLATPLDTTRLAGQAHALVRRAADLYGASLAGVVVFGSWARGDAATTSDVDVLVVLDSALPLTRSLYARWDAEALAWDGRPVEVHLVHLPAPGDAPSGVWGEVALDGLVIHEQGHRVSAYLAEVRRAIADRRFVRKVVGGVPYWTREP
jgi:predicted nucleotidyltransferase